MRQKYIWRIQDTGKTLILKFKPKAGQEAKLHLLDLGEYGVAGAYYVGEQKKTA